MIHQLIFARPRPDISEQLFHAYWDVHADRYARHIPGIARYAICQRVETGRDGEAPPFSGVAEIWFQNEDDQMASLRSAEFLQGARTDEPNWAAFWATLVLDTDSKSVPVTSHGGGSAGVKIIWLLKRKQGMSVGHFRVHAASDHAAMVQQLPGLRGYVQSFVRDSSYEVGEPRFDAAEQWFFDGAEQLNAALESQVFKEAIELEFKSFVTPKYLLRMAVFEKWIIGSRPEFHAEDVQRGPLKLDNFRVQEEAMSGASTREVAEKWFNSLTKGDVATAISCLHDDVEWINYAVLPEWNDTMPWIGTYRGLEKVQETFRIFGSLVTVEREEVKSLIVDGNQAAGVIHEISLVRDSGARFEIEFIQWLTIRGGKITRWKSYTDPSPILRAIRPLLSRAIHEYANAHAPK